MGETSNIDSVGVPKYAQKAIDVLESSGFEAWCVGGFVRDALLNKKAHDVDIATNALWQQSKEAFLSRGYKVYEIGTKHGTISVMVEGSLLEITTYRIEGKYSDKRHPDTVEFTSELTADLARRDFTMNAIAYHPQRGFCDPYGGRADIETGIIKAVGDPQVRFSEDALRILRACRFASQHGFSIESQTKEAMLEKKELLAHVAKERIRVELDSFFCGDYIHDALLECIEVIAQIIPEALDMKKFDQHTPYHIYDVLEHTAYCMQYCPPSSLVRWCAFFHDIGKPVAFFQDAEGIGHFYGHAKISVDIATKAFARLGLPSTFCHKALLLIKHHDDIIQPEPKIVKRVLRRFDEDPDLLRTLCDLKRGDALSQAPQCHSRVLLADEIEACLDGILAENEVFSIKNLAIDGNDILGLSVPPGPLVGELLGKALDAVIDDLIPNERKALLGYVQKLLEKQSS